MLDICGHQANDFQVTDEFWKKINSSARSFYKPGKYVTFPGYEWSGNTPLGGDRNIYFLNEKGEISRSCEDLIPDGKTKYKSSPNATELFKNLSAQKAPSFAFAHVGGRYADMKYHDKNIEVAVEIHSAWGTFEWLLHDAFDRGYRVGICANSDGHQCRPGASYPGRSLFGSYGGLTCVLSSKLDRKNIAKAMMARHFYATTGNRSLIYLYVVSSTGGKACMGDVLYEPDRGARLNAVIEGTAPLERVDVFNGKKLIRTLFPYTMTDLGSRIKIMFSGAEKKGRARHVVWDGSMKIIRNTIQQISAVNYWNPENTPHMTSKNNIIWESITTGGESGMILALGKPERGIIEIETLHKSLNAI